MPHSYKASIEYAFHKIIEAEEVQNLVVDKQKTADKTTDKAADSAIQKKLVFIENQD